MDSLKFLGQRIRLLLGLTLFVLPVTISVSSIASASMPKVPTAKQIKQCSTAATGNQKMTRSQMASCSTFPKITQHCPKGPSVVVIKIGGKNIAIRFGAKPVRLGGQYTLSQLKAACGVRRGSPPIEAPSGPSQVTTTTLTATLDAEIDALYYTETQAFARSSAAGWQTMLSDDYPGSVDQSKFQACANTNNEQNYSVSAVPNLSTLMPDPTWTAPVRPHRSHILLPERRRLRELPLNFKSHSMPPAEIRPLLYT